MVPGAGWAAICLRDWAAPSAPGLGGSGEGQSSEGQAGRGRGGPRDCRVPAREGWPGGRRGLAVWVSLLGRWEPVGGAPGRAFPTLSVPLDDTGRGLVADGRGVGLPPAPGELAQLHREVPDRGGAVAARHPPQTQAARRHVGLGHLELPGGRGPLCGREDSRSGSGHPERPRGAGCLAQMAGGRAVIHSDVRVPDSGRTWLETPFSPSTLHPRSGSRQTADGPVHTPHGHSGAGVLSNTWALPTPPGSSGHSPSF